MLAYSQLCSDVSMLDARLLYSSDHPLIRYPLPSHSLPTTLSFATHYPLIRYPLPSHSLPFRTVRYPLLVMNDARETADY